MGTVCMAGNVAFRTLAGVLAAKRKHVTTVAAPVGTDVGQWLEAMGNTMVDLFLVLTRLVGFGDTFSDNLLVAFLVASVATILALITHGVE